MPIVDNVTIYEQYIGTNIQELLDGELEILNNTIGKAIESIKSQVFDLKTASGDALDMWGRLLNFSRYIPVPDPTEQLYFQNFSFYDCNFTKLKFFDSSDIAYAKLDDYSYRQVLTLLFQSQNITPTVQQTTALAQSIFNTNITIGDKLDMEYQVYYYSGRIPDWLDFIIKKYDIFPRPACVKQNIVDTAWKIFGFSTDDLDWSKQVTAFWNSQFLGNRAPPPSNSE